ncbi:MAG TPA: TonB C-terminal domain-containing protein [Rhodocyclaceae bacterium]|nr:TonB C-terminal domain-containing protein [Rhodocyclaceae bacterium]
MSYTAMTMTPPPIPRTLTYALVASLAFHAALLSLHFELPQRLARASKPALDVIMVNSKSANKPTDAQAKAQVNSDGGGNTAADVRATTALPPSTTENDGDAFASLKRRAVELQSEQQQLLTGLKSKRYVTSQKNTPDPSPKSAPLLSGTDLVESSLNTIKLRGEIARSTSEVNKHPLRKIISVRTTAAPEVMYVDAVLQKIERVGTLNFPASVRSNAYGKLLVTLVINPDGSLFSFELDTPSDSKVLNAAARRIAEMSAPFPKVPGNVLDDMGVIAITRWWSFTTEDLKTR